MGDYFDPDGIIHFQTTEDLKSILEHLKKNGDDVYEEKKEAIEKNYNLVETYRIPEDWIYVNYPFLFN